MSLCETAGGVPLGSIANFGFPTASPDEEIEFNIIVDDTYKMRARKGGSYYSISCLYIVEQGLDGTPIMDLNNIGSSKIELDASSFYEPISVTIGGVRAENLTDYYNGQHKAFDAISQKPNKYQFIQIGRKIYLNTKTSKRIQVKYDYKAKYVQLIAHMQNNALGRDTVTPTLSSYKLAFQTARR